MFINAHFAILASLVNSSANVVAEPEKVPGAAAALQDFPAPAGRVWPNHWGLGIPMVANEPVRFVMSHLPPLSAGAQEPNFSCCQELPMFSR